MFQINPVSAKRCFLSSTLSLLLVIDANAADRVALVIGNATYRELSESRQLTSPVHDAQDVAAALQGMGYTVVTGAAVTDANRETITTATEQFAAAAHGAEAAVFYYSGHGIQVGDDNYLLPSDTPKLSGLSMLKNRAVLLRDSVMVALEEAEVETKVIILDCCRENPFSAQLEQALAQVGKSVRTKSVGEITGYGPGFYLAFATSPGSTAADGNGERNSPFTAALLKALPSGATKDIDFYFRDVKALLPDDQVSWTNHSIKGSFILGPEGVSKVPGGSQPNSDKPSSEAPPAQVWEVVQVGGADYVTVESMVKFYKFSSMEQRNNVYSLRSPTLTVDMQTDAAELKINGVTIGLHLPIRTPSGKICLSRRDIVSVVDPILRPNYIKRAYDVKRIVIDPLFDESLDGKSQMSAAEYQLCRTWAVTLREVLEASGYDVLLTRTTRDPVDVQQRLKIANSAANSIYIGLSFRTTQSRSGIESRILSADTDPAPPGSEFNALTMALSTALHANLLVQLKTRDLGIRRIDEPMLAGLLMPAVTISPGCFSNEEDFKRLNKTGSPRAFASAILDAVRNFSRAIGKSELVQ